MRRGGSLGNCAFCISNTAAILLSLSEKVVTVATRACWDSRSEASVRLAATCSAWIPAILVSMAAKCASIVAKRASMAVQRAVSMASASRRAETCGKSGVVVAEGCGAVLSRGRDGGGGGGG